MQLLQRSLGVKISSMSGVIVPKIFPTFLGKVQILAENLHAYLTKVSFVSKRPLTEPAVSVMAMSLDSHVVDRGSCPGPGGLKLTPGACACVPKIPRGEWRRRDCGVTIPPGGWFLTFCLYVSLCLSGERTRPIAKISPKKKNYLQQIIPHFFVPLMLCLSIFLLNVLPQTLLLHSPSSHPVSGIHNHLLCFCIL